MQKKLTIENVSVSLLALSIIFSLGSILTVTLFGIGPSGSSGATGLPINFKNIFPFNSGVFVILLAGTIVFTVLSVISYLFYSEELMTGYTKTLKGSYWAFIVFGIISVLLYIADYLYLALGRKVFDVAFYVLTVFMVLSFLFTLFGIIIIGAKYIGIMRREKKKEGEKKEEAKNSMEMNVRGGAGAAGANLATVNPANPLNSSAPYVMVGTG